MNESVHFRISSLASCKSDGLFHISIPKRHCRLYRRPFGALISQLFYSQKLGALAYPHEIARCFLERVEPELRCETYMLVLPKLRTALRIASCWELSQQSTR